MTLSFLLIFLFVSKNEMFAQDQNIKNRQLPQKYLAEVNEDNVQALLILYINNKFQINNFSKNTKRSQS